tara:strand:+ start:11433 stop:12299 length:867 start_codon:yes stop_codon:yes gene_type:complete
MIDSIFNLFFLDHKYFLEANLNYFSVLAEKVTVPGTPLEALMWGFIAFFIQPVSAIFGAKFKISKKFISIALAFSSGVLIALLTYDLLDVSFELGGLFPTIMGLLLGIFTYIFLNKLISNLGARLAHSPSSNKRCKTESNDEKLSYALIVGALIDGIPESASIGISLLENRIVSASIIVGIIIANIPEGIASGAGLKKSGYNLKNITLIWLIVASLCSLSSFLAFIFLSNVSLSFQALIIAFAGGGVLAMVLQSVVPEAYQGTHEQVSIFGALGFSSIFIISKVMVPH